MANLPLLTTTHNIAGNTLAPTGQQYDKKSGQWFGSLVQSSGENGVVLVRKSRKFNFEPLICNATGVL